MKRSVRSRLIDRLKNGKPMPDGTRKPYRQITTRLAADDNGDLPRCILGVLCDLAEEDGVVTKYKSKHSSRWVYRSAEDHHDYSDTTLPFAVVEWAGVQKQSPIVENGINGFDSLINLNDNGLFDFNGFADLIEKNPDL